MDNRRLSERNRILNEIQTISCYITKDTSSIDRLELIKNSEYAKAQIIKLTDKIQVRKTSLETFKCRLSLLETGQLDSELLKIYEQNKIEIDRKTNEKKQKKKIEEQNKLEDSRISKAFYQINRQSDREYRRTEKDADRALKHFNKTNNGLPDHIKRNLSGMPSNKGYIWKGVHFYGCRKPERNRPIVMFEKVRGGILRIYEYTPTEILISEKQGKNRKVLVSREARKQKLHRNISFFC
jgi:hypothetical protein